MMDEYDDGEEMESKRKGRKSGPTPNETAQRILEDRRFVEDAGGTIYSYDGDRGHWVAREPATMLAIIHGYVDWATHSYRANVVRSIAAASHDAELQWGRVATHEVAVKNGVIDLERMEIRPHRWSDWLDYVIPHEWHSTAECPVWLAALDDWVGIDSDKGLAVQEFFGYLLMPHAHYKRAAVFYGEGDTGKTRPLMAMKALIGGAATCSLGIEHMDDAVIMAMIKHKRLNMLTELSADAMIRDGGFKTLVSTEEPIPLNAKFKSPEMYIPVAKHVIACNSLPDVNDRTAATFNRLLIIPFNNVVPKERQDPDLDEKIAAEVCGLLAWAVDGARRLYQNDGRFTEIGEAQEIIANYRAEANPIHDFAGYELVRDDGSAVPLIDLVKRYNERRYGRQLDARRMGRMARSAWGKDAVRSHRPGANLAPVKCLMGWRWREGGGTYPSRGTEPP